MTKERITSQASERADRSVETLDLKNDKILLSTKVFKGTMEPLIDLPKNDGSRKRFALDG